MKWKKNMTWNWSYGICIYFLKTVIARGYNDDNFFLNFTAMDTATARRGYSNGQAWIQRRLGVDIATARRGYNDDPAWIQRWPSMDTETARRGYSDGLDI